MKLKQILAAAMVSLMAVGLVAGCGGDKKKSADNGKKVQIEYWHVAAESFGGATVKELVADFNKTHPNIEVTAKYNPDMYKGLTQNLQDVFHDLEAARERAALLAPGYEFMSAQKVDLFKLFKKRRPDYL